MILELPPSTPVVSIVEICGRDKIVHARDMMDFLYKYYK